MRRLGVALAVLAMSAGSALAKDHTVTLPRAYLVKESDVVKSVQTMIHDAGVYLIKHDAKSASECPVEIRAFPKSFALEYEQTQNVVTDVGGGPSISLFGYTLSGKATKSTTRVTTATKTINNGFALANSMPVHTTLIREEKATPAKTKEAIALRRAIDDVIATYVDKDHTLPCEVQPDTATFSTMMSVENGLKGEAKLDFVVFSIGGDASRATKTSQKLTIVYDLSKSHVTVAPVASWKP